jgi:UDP-GlcNAc:undecaprenyl-phosphate/decaprenyl-phosphate GlcNAc-1-phosphate transferase
MAPVHNQAGTLYLLGAAGTAVLAALISYVLTPIVQKAALAHGAAHEPRARDIHTHPVARWGGLAIYAAFVVAVLLSLALAHWGFGRNFHWSSVRAGFGIFLAATALSIIGAFDDLYDISPGKQMLIQLLCAALVIPFGVRIDVLSDPFNPGGQIHLGFWTYPATLLWIVGVTNAINWIDGLDGLAAGVCAIAAMALTMMAIVRGQPALALMAAALCGSLLGFLRYNFNPARIFMGGGALFVGFCLATIATVGAFKVAAAMALVVPILILGVPIFDTAFVIVRRFLNGRPVYQADTSHLHHRLLARGFSQRQTVLILYVVSLGLSVVAVLLAFRSST